jgi:hypothetical protein
MVPEIFERSATIAIVEVANPPSYGSVDFVHYPHKRPCRSRSLREFGNTIFDNLGKKEGSGLERGKKEGSGLERGQIHDKLYVKPAEGARDGKTFTNRI